MKRARTSAPSADDFGDFRCTDSDALESLEPALLWLAEGPQATQADRLNYLEQLLYHKLDFDAEKVRSFKKLRSDRLPSFSEIKWKDLAVFNIDTTFRLLPKQFDVPICLLPFSLHRKIKCDGWVKMDVNGDVEAQGTEAGVVNIGQYVRLLFGAPCLNLLFNTAAYRLSKRFSLSSLGGSLIRVNRFFPILRYRAGVGLSTKLVSSLPAHDQH